MNSTCLSLFRFYRQSFESHPYRTVAFTNGALNAFGDSVAQFSQRCLGQKQDRPQHYDFPRTLRFFAFGFGLGPFIGRWNIFLENTFPLRAAAAGRNRVVSLRALSKRVAADQLLFAPLGLVGFIGSMGVMEGRDTTHINEKYRDMFMPALVSNWSVWPMIQLINFRYLPLPYRIPFSSTCGVFWTLYLSILNSREDIKQDREDEIRHQQKTLDAH